LISRLLQVNHFTFIDEMKGASQLLKAYQNLGGGSSEVVLLNQYRSCCYWIKAFGPICVFIVFGFAQVDPKQVCCAQVSLVQVGLAQALPICYFFRLSSLDSFAIIPKGVGNYFIFILALNFLGEPTYHSIKISWHGNAA